MRLRDRNLQSIITAIVDASTESAHAKEDRSLPTCLGIIDRDLSESVGECDSFE